WNQVENSLPELKSLSSQLTSYTTWQQMSATSANAAVVGIEADSSAAEGTYSAVVSKLAQSHRVGSDAQTSATAALGLEGTFTIGGQEIAVTADQSLENLRDAINLASLAMDDGQAVKASIVDTTLVLTRVATGATEISLADGGGDVLEALGILDAGKTVKNELVAAQNLEAKILGIDIVRASNSDITDVIAGATLDFTGEGTATFTIERDRDTLKSLITDFVAKYNSTMEMIEAQGASSVTGGEDVETATLSGDALLRSIQSRGRTLLTSSDDTDTLDNALDSLRKIGIWTTGKENRLAITDSAALDDALENDFEAVESLFRDYDAGIMRKYDDYLRSLTAAADGSINRHQQGLQDKIDRYDATIANMERRLVSYEEQLWKKYAAAETIIASLQSQADYVTSLFTQKSSED
ncbi:MAG: flagellar filament capping protein FliD, partial [Lentisphaeria bacterium]|nr:flagellar filament capping protein FliD [Lentisphaeria bacterium]